MTDWIPPHVFFFVSAVFHCQLRARTQTPRRGEITQPRATLWDKGLRDLCNSPDRGEIGEWMSPFQGFSFWFGIIVKGVVLGFLIFPLRGKF